MKKTELYHTHLALNAKMISFGGYQMPLHYTSVKKEHIAVRESLGVFDISHMGEFYISGPNAMYLLQYICSNDISKIQIGKAQYNYFPNYSGGVVDDLIVYRIEESKYLLVVNASNIEKDWNWIQNQNQKFNAKVENHSEKIALLAIQGPNAIEAMQQLTNASIKKMSPYTHKTSSFAGFQNVLIATTGYTGAGGIEIYISVKEIKKVWQAIFEAGSQFGIVPVGLAARDTLRTEMGYCLYGNEISEITSPISAGLGWITKPETNFINSKNIGNSKTNGTKDKLVGFIMDKRSIPRKGYIIVNENENQIGSVTSGTQSPTLSQGIGMGYVNAKDSIPGKKIGIIIRERTCFATIVPPPFIKSNH